MSKGKRYTDEGMDLGEIPWKKIGIIALIIVALIGIGFGVYFGINTYKNKQNEKQQETLPQENKEPEPKMVEKIAGYDVLGRVVLESVNIDKYILNSSEDDALQKGVCKLYGNGLNEEGNFVIIGHNYDDVFKKLEELEIGDEFFVEDRNLEKTQYKITEIIAVEPTDLSILLPKENKTEITLVTCQTGATTRLVVKAEKLVTSDDTEEPEEQQNTVEDQNVVSE